MIRSEYGKTDKKDLCPKLPGIWYENEVCAIVSRTGDGKSLLAETLALEAEAGPRILYIDDHNGMRHVVLRAGRHLWRGNSTCYREVDPCDRTGAKVVDGIERFSGGVVIDLGCPMLKTATVVGEAIAARMAGPSPISPLVTVQDDRMKTRTLKAYHVQRVSLLERVRGWFRITTDYGTPAAKSYCLKVIAADGVRFVVDDGRTRAFDKMNKACRSLKRALVGAEKDGYRTEDRLLAVVSTARKTLSTMEAFVKNQYKK